MPKNSTNPDQRQPLSEATYFILLSLAPMPKHGYAIMKDVQSLSEGRVRLGTGTLYGAIKRLLAHGWIEPVEEPTPQPNRRNRKAYSLTKLGRRILEAEVNRLQNLVHAARLQTGEERI